jgi:hypothetical protein
MAHYHVPKKAVDVAILNFQLDSIFFLSSANSEHSLSADLKLDHVLCSNFFYMFHADNFFMAAFNPIMILFSPLYIVYICQRS